VAAEFTEFFGLFAEACRPTQFQPVSTRALFLPSAWFLPANQDTSLTKFIIVVSVNLSGQPDNLANKFKTQVVSHITGFLAVVDNDLWQERQLTQGTASSKRG
jgi:hypothetical protein